MRKFIYKILEIPIVYTVITNILGPGGFYFRRKINEKVFANPAKKSLDVGCGPAPTTPEPAELLVGLDVNKDYLMKYTGGFVDSDPQLVLTPPPGRKRLAYLASADKMPFLDGSFDEIRSVSFFHHMSDSEAENTLREMNRSLKVGGRMIMFDMVWPKNRWTRPIAHFIVSQDRGRFARTEEQLVALFQRACPGDWQWKRYTYTLTGLELLCLQYIKK